MSALDKVREPIVGLLRRPSAYFAGEWERYSPKRKQVIAGGCVNRARSHRYRQQGEPDS